MTVMQLVILIVVPAALLALGYLAACAAAGRWLSLGEWWGLCQHRHGRLLAIEFDGEVVYECASCGKHIRRPLS